MRPSSLLLCVILLLAGCSTVPVTGRHQLNLIPEGTMVSMSLQQYDQFLKEHPPSKDQQATEMVRRVGSRIADAVQRYFASIGKPQQVSGYKWEFNLVDDKQVNAWCMPGGKVVVYSGILPLTKDENGLAVVLGHEIAHAVAEHGNERMSQGLMAELGGVALATALSTKPAQTQQLWMVAYGAGAQYGAILPFSRLQESEADHLGLVFMTLAGYDPEQAIPFWERMASQKGGKGGPEFLSTHPADKTRIEQIKKLIPEVEQKYKNKSPSP